MATALRGIVLSTLLAGGAAFAEPIPAPVAAMIDAVAADPAALKTIADVAKKTNPASAAEIDARVAAIADAASAARTDKLAHQGALEGWSGEGELGAFNSTGNAHSTGLAAGLKFSREGLRWKHTLTGVADYQRDNGITSKERFFAGYDINYKISPRFYALGLLNYERDRIAGFDSRFNEGVGFGYKAIDTPRLSLAVEGGPALRQTRFVTGHDDSSFAGRAAANLLWRLGPTTTVTDTTSYYFGGETDTLTTEAAITAKLYGALSARLSFYVQNESHPAHGRAATDTTSRVTLVYAFHAH